MKLIIDIPKSRYNEIVSGIFDADSYFKTNLTLAFRNGTPIPDNATNGDVIKTMFPNIEVEEQGKDLFIVFNMDIQGTPFYKAWWNSPYQKGGK